MLCPLGRPGAGRACGSAGASRQDLVIDGIMKRREQIASGAELIHYFTEDGLREFAENGRFADYPEEYVRALTREERVRILDGMLADMERPGCDMGIVKEQSLHLTKMLNIFVSSAVGASLVLYDPEQGFHQLLIQEPSITQAFDTYIRGMRDHWGGVLQGGDGGHRQKIQGWSER